MRRKTFILAGIILIASIAAVAAYAHGPVMGWGRWGNMMGYWDDGPAYGNLTGDQRNQLETLDRKFYEQTADLRSRLEAKSAELNSLLYAQNPDKAKIESIQRDIEDLQSKLDQKRLDYDLQVRKIDPNAGYGYNGYPMGGYGHMMGGGYGHMGGYGYGHMMGYGYGGPGACW